MIMIIITIIVEILLSNQMYPNEFIFVANLFATCFNMIQYLIEMTRSSENINDQDWLQMYREKALNRIVVFMTQFM